MCVVLVYFGVCAFVFRILLSRVLMNTSRINQADCGDFVVDMYSDHGDDHDSVQYSTYCTVRCEGY
jgi:hypothetical protein